MKNILVPCDFSKPAVNALKFALDVANRSKGVIHLLNVIELPAIHDPIIMPVVSLEKDFMKDLKENITGQFEKLLSKQKILAATVKTDILFGSPATMIQDYSRKKKIDMIIMGSQGARGLKEYFIGSNAEKIVRNSTIPVLVLKDYYKGAMRNIVFANNLEATDETKLIEKLKELQTFFKARLHLVYINTPTNFKADNITMARLREFAKRYNLKNFTLNIFNYPFEEAGIIHFTKSVNGDLIAMGTHGRKGLAHFLNGSLAEDIVNHADRPIWTFAKG